MTKPRQSNDFDDLPNGPAEALNGPVALDAEHLRLLAEEVIRRVAAQAREVREEGLRITEEKLDRLSEALLRIDDHDRAATIVRDARLAGMTADALYHGLVAGAVKRVWDAWAREEIGLHDVMRASGRVWRILRDLRDVFVNVTARIPGQRAVLALCPGEWQSIDLTMTADDLRRRGWDIDLLLGYDEDALLAQLSKLSPTTVALAATKNDLALPLARTIVALRAHLPGVWILVAGQIARDVPDLLAISGADALATSTDQVEAAMLAHLEDLSARRANRV